MRRRRALQRRRARRVHLKECCRDGDRWGGPRRSPAATRHPAHGRGLRNQRAGHVPRPRPPVHRLGHGARPRHAHRLVHTDQRRQVPVPLRIRRAPARAALPGGGAGGGHARSRSERQQDDRRGELPRESRGHAARRPRQRPRVPALRERRARRNRRRDHCCARQGWTPTQARCSDCREAGTRLHAGLSLAPFPHPLHPPGRAPQHSSGARRVSSSVLRGTCVPHGRTRPFSRLICLVPAALPLRVSSPSRSRPCGTASV